MGNLTDTAVRTAKARDKAYKLADGDGLYVRVTADGEKSWLVRYMHGGKECQYMLPERYGKGPGHLGLAEARDRAKEIRALARAGIDYQQKLVDDQHQKATAAAQAVNNAKTVADLYAAWLPTIAAKNGNKGRKDGGAEVARTFDKYVLPAVGNLALTQLIAGVVKPVLTAISARGHNRQATALLTDFKQMVRWGERNQPYKRLLIDCDVLGIEPHHVTGKVKGEERNYDPSKDNQRERFLCFEEPVNPGDTPNEIRLLAQALPKSGLSIAMQSAIRAMLSTGCRVGETVAAEWTHINLKDRIWRIPAENTKTGEALDIWLSDFALAQFQRLWDIRQSLPEKHRSKYVFASSTDTAKHINVQTIGKAIKDRQRFDSTPIKGRTARNAQALVLPGGQWRCHDLRRTAFTLMQALKVPESIAHLCLNHAQPNKLTSIYGQYGYSEEMQEAWEKLGARLSKIITGQ